ncbi:MAG: 4Fe-4S dicluster domain-containing protein [Caldithrix sp.]|nr:4Fe-4S dicluster domain-containing protein [Caldithrix sp.]
MSSMSMKKELKGKDYWRSLDQLAETDEFKSFLNREFPENASEMTNPVSRRKFLSLMGASIAFAGLAGCRKPVEKIVPYVNAPENIKPGIANYYATSMPFGLDAQGLLVESHEGRPTKVEGNDKHPWTNGKSNAWIQASILGLYDPDRSKAVLQDGVEKQWEDFVEHWRQIYFKFRETKGQGLVVLSESFASPTLFRLYEAFKKQFPAAQWYAYDPISDENIYEGIRLATGSNYHPIYEYDKANVILSLGADFLLTETGSVRANQGFTAARKVESSNDTMNRLYVVENSFTITGGMADHRMRLENRYIPDVLVALTQRLKKSGLKVDSMLVPPYSPVIQVDEQWLNAVADDLMKNKRQSIILAGRNQPSWVHALTLALNQALGNLDKTIVLKPIKDTLIGDHQQLKTLVQTMHNGQVDTLFILGGNPVYNSPVDLSFSSALKNVRKAIHLSTHVDETSKQVQWHIPLTHYLENWSDTRSMDGTMSVTQPLIAPLFGAHSLPEVLELMTTGNNKRGYEVVRETWKSRTGLNDFEKKWNRILHDGLLTNSAVAKAKVSIDKDSLSAYLKNITHSEDLPDIDNMEVDFAVSPAVYDGRYANNGWLQEMPDPVTKMAWDNAILLSPKAAEALGVVSQDVVKLTYKKQTLEMPVLIMPGQADYSVVVPLGYGRNAAGRIGDGVGVNTYLLRHSDGPYTDMGLTIEKTTKTYTLANTQDHWSMEDRPLVREATLEEFKKHPKFAAEMVEHPPLKSLWEEHSYDEGYQWGMTIDLNACTGCNACVIACQSENNIPIVGKEQVAKGREMHWIRLDRYFSGDIDDPEMVYQPVACQHCENAPCEQVCPVAATVHDEEGLNVMTYNRCIGTRYCSNNCPYKVRRFNFFNYTNDMSEVIQMAQNPDVTVRSRGVMEKCTFCVQRISEAKIRAKNEERKVRDGEIVTACQQACPANAIAFGDINDSESVVSKMKNLDRNYTMLAELNVQTRNTFLAKLRNPNPELEKA